MNGYIFTLNMSNNPKHEFNRTLKELQGYAAQECDSPNLFMPLFGKDPTSPAIITPTEPNDVATSDISKALYIDDLKEYRREMKRIKNGEVKLFECIMGQCEEQLKAKLKGLVDFEQKDMAKDCAWLLKEIKKLHFKFEEKKDPFMNLVNAKHQLMTHYQGRNEELSDFYTKFKNRVEVIEHQGGSIGMDMGIVVHMLEQNNNPILARKVQEDDDLDVTEKILVKIAKNQASERYLASLFLKVVSKAKYGSLLDDLQNQVSWGQEVMPDTLAGAYDICLNYRGTTTRQNRNQNTEAGLTFLQQGESRDVPGTDGIVHPGIPCYRCQQNGHYATNCPVTNENAQANTQVSGIINTTVSTNENSSTDDDGVFGVCCTQIEENLESNVTLLDNQSTHSIFRTKDKLENIRICGNGGLTMRSSGGGHFHTKLIGDYRRLGMTVWFSEEAMADILAMCDVEKKYRVTMDSAVESSFVVHSQPKMKFAKAENGLYVFMEGQSVNFSTNLNQNNAYSFAQVNRTFSPRELRDATRAFELYQRTTLSPSFFKEILRKNHLLNTNCTAIDLARHEYVHGKDVANLRGRTTRKKPMITPHFIPEGLPGELLAKIQNINLCVDIFYFLGRRFLHTISKGIRYVTATTLPDENEPTLKRELGKVCKIYSNRGFSLALIKGDNQFECLKHQMPCEVECVTKGEHEPNIERSIRTQEEHTRTLVHRVPFLKFPIAMADSAAISPCYYRNAFPNRNNISEDISPRTMVTGRGKLDVEREMKVAWGRYCEVYSNTEITNDAGSRTIAAISLHPANQNGGYYFMNLDNGAVFRGNQWTEMPMTHDVIDAVHRLADNQNMPSIRKNGRLFLTDPGLIHDYENRGDQDYQYQEDNDSTYDDDDYDTDVDPRLLVDSSDTGVSDTDLDVHDHGDDINSDPSTPNDEEEDDTTLQPPESSSDAHSSEDERSDEDEQSTPEQNLSQHFNAVADDSVSEDDNEENESENNNEDSDENDSDYIPEDDIEDETTDNSENEEHLENSDDTDEDKDETQNQRSENNPTQAQRSDNTAQNQRSDDDTTEDQRSADEEPDTDEEPRRTKRTTTRHDYSTVHKTGFTFHQAGNINNEEMYKQVANRALQALVNQKEGQLNDKTISNTLHYEQAIKRWGETALEATIKEIAQIHRKEVLEPTDITKLSNEEIDKALNIIALVTQKRCGRTKGRAVADGRDQKDVPREERASPTLSKEGLMGNVAQAIYENREHAVGDVPGAFLNGEFGGNEKIHVKFTGRLIDILCDIDPSFKSGITFENGKRVLYARLARALYGTVQAALRWYLLFKETLEGLGFKLNPYDLCIANANVEGSQCTIAFYVDDLFCTHKKRSVLEWIDKEISDRFGDIKMKYGKELTYLGIDFKFNTEDKYCAMTMKSHLQDAIDTFMEYGNTLSHKTRTPATTQLREIDPDSPKVHDKKMQGFRRVVMKLLYIGQRTRMDILPTVSFLMTRQGITTIQDWKKLQRLIQYIIYTIELPHIIGVDTLEELHTFIDVAFAVNPDRKSQTGGYVTFGRGGVHSESSKQKLNSKSSTEGEIIGFSDYLTIPIWFRYYLQAQGYENVKGFLHQDNMSAMRIENNAQMSMGRKTKHMEIRYFYVKDRVTGNNMTIRYCPTQKMIADFFTKPLQGELFRKFRAVVMGHVHLNEVILHSDTCKERVEEREKELKKRREESKKIQEKEVPDIFHHVVKRDDELKRDDDHKLKLTYAHVVKKGMEEKRPLK